MKRNTIMLIATTFTLVGGFEFIHPTTHISADTITEITNQTQPQTANKNFVNKNVVMLDVSRRHMTKQQILDFIKNIDTSKFQVLQLHLSDNEGFALKTRVLGHNSGWLSKQDIEEICTAANERGIQVVPDIDVPGHSGGIIQILQNTNSRWLNKAIIMDPEDLDYTNPDTLSFVKQLYHDALASFNNQEINGQSVQNYVVAGADEVPGNLANADNFAHFLNGLDEYCNRYGYQMVVWNDCINNRVATQLNKNIIINYWTKSDANNSIESLQNDNFSVKNVGSNFSYINTEDLDNEQLRENKATNFSEHNDGRNELCFWGGGENDKNITNAQLISYLNQVQNKMK